MALDPITFPAPPVEPAPISAGTVVLTPKGNAVVAVIRLERLVRALDRADRLYVAELLASIVEDLSRG